ncbi:lysophospholipid acyltransferase family protein [Pseudonocardia abyssalis]|uniref:1-acyl-sn-glycerol-3-phosphate acyltransferase n=1 Tax=Pseudonocardia abyssalis TaxID=2792008 RepID=A0ABS6UU03_9PSEU|nr:lysophospholipid acyltransferase family protein [Pseudonocardia abyssalis]MBW0116883.1 1-acyl-sn-glycerol-3-phosphate acyltransferase [Pseudonocardia abyssalis]MBW0135745.1 1-acyl-sn-glycerol-3-phosphate acyltransferase [Pseudonocardia abyssalis]
MRREKRGFWIAFCAVFFYPIGWLTGQSRYEGREHIPATGGALIVANHISHLDPIFSGLIVERSGRVPRFLAKHSLWSVPVLGQALAGSGQIPVYRESADAQQSLRDGTAALKEGKVVIIYPEGTITRDPETWPMHARTGVARLALTSDVPVVPMVHWGTHRVLDGYNKKFRPLPRGPITVRCGEPVDLSAYRGRPVDSALLREVTDLLMVRVRDLLAEVRGEPAPVTFYKRAS